MSLVVPSLLLASDQSDTYIKLEFRNVAVFSKIIHPCILNFGYYELSKNFKTRPDSSISLSTQLFNSKNYPD